MTRSTTRAASRANEVLPVMTGLLVSMTHAVQRWRQCRRDARHLEELSDSQLKDIGLSRGAIMAAVNGRLRNNV